MWGDHILFMPLCHGCPWHAPGETRRREGASSLGWEEGATSGEQLAAQDGQGLCQAPRAPQWDQKTFAPSCWVSPAESSSGMDWAEESCIAKVVAPPRGPMSAQLGNRGAWSLSSEL